MPPSTRCKGVTKVAILTIVDDEFVVTQELFGLKHRIGISEYFARAEAADNRFDLVLRRASDAGAIGSAIRRRVAPGHGLEP
jgi:hypothetical protein